MRAYVHLHVKNSEIRYWLSYDEGKPTLSRSVLCAEAVPVDELQVRLLELINAGHRPVKVIAVRCKNTLLTNDMRKTLNLC